MSPRQPNLLDALRRRFEGRRPIRAGSLIVTLYGDAIAPRGGSLWLGSLNELMRSFGIEPGLVRTAMSRLVGEGWFERTRRGRNSFYRLSAKGAAEFAEAGRRIYRGGEVRWDGGLGVLVLGADDPRRRQEQRDALSRLGYGQLAPNVMLRPSDDIAGSAGAEVAAAAEGAIRMNARIDTDGDAARRLARQCWQLGDLGTAYQGLLEDLGPLTRPHRALEQPDDEQAFQIRILLIHEYRRIVLRDPLLPPELLPPDWPGAPVRETCRKIY